MKACSSSASYLRWWLLKALLFLAALLQTSSGCPKSCACHVLSEVHCTFKYLTAVPDHIQPAVEKINLGYNSISVLKENDFSGLQNLEQLMLHSNTIERIEDGAFRDLKSLQVLKMSYNKVKQINKETFKGLDSLLRLHMDHNHIDFISPEAFYGLTNLQLVHLESNHLQQLHPDTFITLRHSQVFKLSSVRNIHLSDNLLTTLPADIFTGSTKLENVFLHGNPWTCDCRMKWFPSWTRRNAGVLKCKRDRRYPSGQLCPVCENPVPYYKRPLSLLPHDAFTCVKPWIQPYLKKKNITLEEGDFTPVSAKDFIAPLGSIQMNLTDQLHSDASLSCTVQRPVFENLTQTIEEEEGNNVTVITSGITTYLVCNVDYEHIQQLWQILASYSDSPLRLERGLMLARSPEMVYRYRQLKAEEEEERMFTNIEAEIKASPPWLMQGEVSFQLDRTATTYSTLHIKYQSVVHLRVERTVPKRDRYSWTMIKRDNQTQTENTVLTGGLAHLRCQVQGEPKPLLEWILPDGSKVRAPYTDEDRRITITAEGELTLSHADPTDTGLYQCIATNYLDADILIFRLTVLSPDVEEAEVNGVQLSRPLGEHLTFDCISSGRPKPFVQWILPDQSVVHTSHGNRKVFKNGTLWIQRLTERDWGFYRCLVSNYLGADLLISQVTVTGQTPNEVTILDGEGSGEENTISPNESPSSSPSDRNSQESRTVTSDRPFPRHRLRGRGGHGGRLGRGRGRVNSKFTWSRKVFDKASRKVDPDKFAEIMKKAQNGQRKNTDKEKESIKNEGTNLDGGDLDDGEIGSGLVYNEDHLIAVPRTYETETINNGIFSRDTQTETTIYSTDKHHSSKMETAVKSTFTEYPGFVKQTHMFHPLERTSKSPLSIHPVTVQLTLLDTSEETQIQFSGEQPADPETSTESALPITPQPNVTQMRNGTVELVVHTDPQTQTVFTAGTTTERQEQITFHATQTIKSPQLPAGSTLISQQQIRIIPHKNSRDGVRRRTFEGRRRIIKPNRITDIQSLINKLKESSVKKEENVSVPYHIEQTIGFDDDRGKKRTTPLQVQAVTPTAFLFSPGLQTQRPSATQKPAAPTTNYWITSKVPFTHAVPESKDHSFYGDTNRLRPLTTEKTQSTAQITTVTLTPTTAVIPATTTNSLAEPETLSLVSTESSGYDDLGDLSAAHFEMTTLRPTHQAVTTTSSPYFSRYRTTPETPPKLHTLPSPPTVKPPSSTNLDDSLSSGSGGLPDNWDVITQKPGRTRGRQGQGRRPFRGRRPFKKPGISKLHRATTTEAPTTTFLSTEATTKTTPHPQQTASLYEPFYTTSRENVMTDQIPKEDTNLYEYFDWSVSHSATQTMNPTTTFIPATTMASYTTMETRVHSNIKPPVQRNGGPKTQRPSVERVEPTAQSITTRSSAVKNSNSLHDIGNEATSIFTGGVESTTNVMANKPKIVGGNAASFTILSNSDAFLPCEAVGMPQPDIAWKRVSSSTGKTFPIKGRMDNFEVLSNGTLYIKNASIKDRGQYLCLAENDYGVDKLLVTLSVVAYPSRILEPKVRDIKSNAGDTVEMKCEAEGRPSPMISWILANRTQVRGQNTGNERVSLSAEGTLVLEDVSIYDRGHYKCIASNPAGADTATVRLQVVAAPPGIMEDKQQQIKATVSENLLLPCTGQGNPQPATHWVIHDGTMVQYDRPARETRISVYKNGTLQIKDVTLTDSGIYECIATSSTGSERRVVTLLVERRESVPQIVDISSSVTELFYGDRLRLKCSATGEPKPRIMWRLPSKALVDQWHRMGSRIQVLDNGTLIINTVNDKDDGDYLCVARNPMGDDLQLIRVSVSMKPAKIEPKHSTKKQVPYGNDLRVDCKASGAPKPEISWGLPDGTLVNSALQSDASSGGGRARRYTLFDNGTLYLNQVGMSEEGDYTCYAENQIGKDEMRVHISVLTTAPRIRSHSQTFARVRLGGNVRFDCESIGEPKPKMFWLLPNNDVIAASNEHYVMHVNGSLDIRDVKVMDAGEYVCIARNPAGEDRKAYELDIDGNPPVINGYRQNKTVIKEVAAKYSRKLIDCHAEGNPPPTVTWIMSDHISLKAPYFGSRINIHHNGTLEIRNVRPTDSAEFICVAKNDGGEAVMVVQLEVTNRLQRPIFKNPYNERVVSRSGKTAVLNCSAVGYPVPEITWTLPNGTKFAGGPDRGSRHHLGNDGTFIIYNPGKDDAGKYRCGAKNSVGYIEKLIILDVGVKPYIVTRPWGILRGMSGEQLFLHCLSEGSPKPRIYWTIPGGHILTGPQILGRYQLLENGTLIVHDTTLHDRGNYICRAQNNAGDSVITVPVVIVAYHPRITAAPPPNVRARTGTPIQLGCVASGIPKPEIIWELPDRSVLSTAQRGRSMGTELLHPQGTLVIQRPKASDSGTYKCVAKNYLGTDSKVTYVHVL